MTSSLMVYYITKYGYLGLYLILGTSILGIPVPDEFLLTFVGFLSFTGKLNPLFAIGSAAAGSMTGITVAYLLGTFFQRKVLAHLKKHTGSARLQKVLDWYHRHGGKLLTIGYFIPGVRHLSGYIAGLSRVKYRNFAFFAYLGATLWTSLFVILGRALGSNWEKILPVIHRYALIVGIGAAVFFIAFYLVYKNHERWGPWLLTELQRLPGRYLSLGKKRLLVTAGSLAFLALFLFLMGLIQDLVSHEVGQFDQIVANWLQIASPPLIIQIMQLVNSLGTHLAIALVFVIAIFYLGFSTKSWTHIIPLGLAWIGGTLIDQLFRFLFRGENVNAFENFIPFQAPSPGFLIGAISFYAVLSYLIGRTRPWWTQLLMLAIELLLLLLLGISPIYLRVHTPSAVVTGMTVSGLWALICVFLYEFIPYRIDKRSH